jgi:hypothetical protein
MGKGTRQFHKGNAQALGRRSDGAANGSPTKMATAPPMAKPSAAQHKGRLLCHISVPSSREIKRIVTIKKKAGLHSVK